jgi:hypothetical protein
MDRRELMRMIALATGLSLAAAGASEAGGRGNDTGKGAAAERSNAQGFEKSGNPKAAGGPQNPGVGNPHAYHG